MTTEERIKKIIAEILSARYGVEITAEETTHEITIRTLPRT